jgi:hypothetical protein
LNPAEITSSLGDLIVYLHRGNGAKAESIVENVASQLKLMLNLQTVEEPDGQKRAQQTMFAIDEVKLLLAQRDFSGAAAAARDAAAEWRQNK